MFYVPGWSRSQAAQPQGSEKPVSPGSVLPNDTRDGTGAERTNQPASGKTGDQERNAKEVDAKAGEELNSGVPKRQRAGISSYRTGISSYFGNKGSAVSRWSNQPSTRGFCLGTAALIGGTALLAAGGLAYALTGTGTDGSFCSKLGDSVYGSGSESGDGASGWGTALYDGVSRVGGTIASVWGGGGGDGGGGVTDAV